MPKTIVFGASGFIGRHLIRQCDPTRISPVTRDRREKSSTGERHVHWVEADLSNPESITSTLSPGSTVINLAYAGTGSGEENIAMAVNLGRACVLGRVARLVHCSTAVIIGNNPAPIVSEDTPCLPTTAYERTKHEIERALFHTVGGRVPLYILRPTAVVGPGGQNLRKLLTELRHGDAPSNFVRSSVYGARRMNLVPVEDVVGALLFLGEQASPAPGVFICAADEDPDNRYDRVERIMRHVLNKPSPVPPVRLPVHLLNVLLRLTRSGSGRLANRVYSSDKLRRSGFRRIGSVSSSVRAFVLAEIAGDQRRSSGA